MPEFDLDAALEAQPGHWDCPKCRRPMSVSTSFQDFSAWATFTCTHGCGAGDRAETKQIEMALVDVETPGEEVPVGDPMQNIRDSRCLYGCGRSSISTGISRLKGNEVEVEMSCDACDGTWAEYYLIPEVASA